MKTLKIILLSLVTFLTSCSSGDDDNNPNPQNNPPSDFNLVNPSNNTTNVDVLPTLSWNSATDQDGDTITYSIFLDDTNNPSTLVGTTSSTSFTLEDRLSMYKTFNWRVTANDGNGGTSTSNTATFDSRGVQFSNATLNATFGNRYAMATTVFDNKIWLSGGDITSFANTQNDVWFSEDGINWTQATANAAFQNRRSHSMVSFDNKLWVIGGSDGISNSYNDVWNSIDGVNWNLVTDNAGFANDALFSKTLVFDDKMWLIGGIDSVNSEIIKIWNSTDGIIWTLANDTENFALHEAIVFNNKIFVVGGSQNGVKSSTDGINWVTENAAPPFIDVENVFEDVLISQQIRRKHSIAVFDKKLWVIGGIHGGYDVWFSTDGVIWELAVNEAPFERRVDHCSEVLNDKIWVIGGNNLNSQDAVLSDVWFID